MPVIPATQEAEAEESLELKRRQLQGDEMVPLYSTLGDKSKTLPQNKKQTKILMKEIKEQLTRRNTLSPWIGRLNTAKMLVTAN